MEGINHHCKALTRLTKVTVSTKRQLPIKEYQELSNVLPFFGRALQFDGSLALSHFSRVMITIFRCTTLHCSARATPCVCITPKLDAMPRDSLPARARYRHLSEPHCSFASDAKRPSKSPPAPLSDTSTSVAAGPLGLPPEGARRIRLMLAACGDIWAPFRTPSRGDQRDCQRIDRNEEFESRPDGSILQLVPEVDEAEMWRSPCREHAVVSSCL